MRQLTLIAMTLLISVPAESAQYYQVRRATYACADPRAALALNGPAWHLASRHATERDQGRCFRVRPGETWEQISQPSHALRLLRQTPEHPGKPPLYFQSSSVEPQRLRDAPRPGRRQRRASLAPAVARAAVSEIRATLPAPAGLRAPALVLGAVAPASAQAMPVVPGVRPIMARPGLRQPQPQGGQRLFAPLLVWALIIALAFLMVRLVLRRQRRRALASTAAYAWAEPAETDDSLGACRNRCVAGLRLAGWVANSRFRNDIRGADVIASHGGTLLSVHCHPSMEPVGAGDIEQACKARALQGSDLAAIVSNAAFTEPTRRLAARTGIMLLHEHQLASFAC